MPDTQTPAPAETPTTPTPQDDQSALTPVMQDIADTMKLVKQVITDIQAQGATKAIAADSPQMLAAVTRGYADGKTAWPTIKAGYKTTEFWLVAGLLLANAILLACGKTIPVSTDAVIGSVVSVYAVIRSLVKGIATPDVTPTAAPATTE